MEQFDQQATLALNALHTPFTDGCWRFFSGAVVWVVCCLLMTAYLFYRLGWKQALVAVGACVLTFVLADRISTIVKLSTARLRPCWDPVMLEAGLRVLEGKGHTYSFFSAHSANAAGLALCSWLCLRRDTPQPHRSYAVLAFTLAFLIGISRIFVGKHFLGDVLVGWSAGLLFGTLSAWLSRLIITHAATRRSRRRAPSGV